MATFLILSLESLSADNLKNVATPEFGSTRSSSSKKSIIPDLPFSFALFAAFDKLEQNKLTTLDNEDRASYF